MDDLIIPSSSSPSRSLGPRGNDRVGGGEKEEKVGMT